MTSVKIMNKSGNAIVKRFVKCWLGCLLHLQGLLFEQFGSYSKVEYDNLTTVCMMLANFRATFTYSREMTVIKHKNFVKRYINSELKPTNNSKPLSWSDIQTTSFEWKLYFSLMRMEDLLGSVLSVRASTTNVDHPSSLSTVNLLAEPNRPFSFFCSCRSTDKVICVWGGGLSS